PRADIVDVRFGTAAKGADLCRYVFGRCGVRAFAEDGSTHIINDERRTLSGEPQGLRAPYASAPAGHDGDLPVEGGRVRCGRQIAVALCHRRTPRPGNPIPPNIPFLSWPVPVLQSAPCA